MKHEQLSSSSELPHLPEGLVESHQVGWIPAESLPWLEDQDADKHIGLSELTFENGRKVYLASAGTKPLNKISSEVRGGDTRLSEHGYNRSDTLLLRACRLVAGGPDTENSPLLTRVYSLHPNLDGFSVQGMHETRANSLRVYFAKTMVGNVTPIGNKTAKITQDAPLVIRLGITDKQRQIKTLSYLSTDSKRRMKMMGAGA